MTDECPRCGREIQDNPKGNSHKPITQLYVVHDGYGCDTGCCGHSSIATDEDGRVLETDFAFSHPYDGEDEEQFILDCLGDWPRLFPDAKIDWESCEISND